MSMEQFVLEVQETHKKDIDDIIEVLKALKALKKDEIEVYEFSVTSNL
jgi:hypothetical protein